MFDLMSRFHKCCGNTPWILQLSIILYIFCAFTNVECASQIGKNKILLYIILLLILMIKNFSKFCFVMTHLMPLAWAKKNLRLKNNRQWPMIGPCLLFFKRRFFLHLFDQIDTVRKKSIRQGDGK